GQVLALGLKNSRSLGHIGKGAVAVVVVERGWTALVGRWRTTALYIPQHAIQRSIRFKRHVTAYIEIQAPVPVVIEKSSAAMELPGFESGDTSLVGYVSKGTVAIVVVEHVAAVLGDEKVWKSVVVIVTPNATEAVRRTRYAGFLSHIREGTLAIVTVESVFDGNAAIVAITSIHEINIRPAIIVEVGDADPWTELLQVDGCSFVSLE